MVYTTSELEEKIGRKIGSSENRIFTDANSFVRIGSDSIWRCV